MKIDSKFLRGLNNDGEIPINYKNTFNEAELYISWLESGIKPAWLMTFNDREEYSVDICFAETGDYFYRKQEQTVTMNEGIFQLTLSNKEGNEDKNPLFFKLKFDNFSITIDNETTCDVVYKAIEIAKIPFYDFPFKNYSYGNNIVSVIPKNIKIANERPFYVNGKKAPSIYFSNGVTLTCHRASKHYGETNKFALYHLCYNDYFRNNE
jgi:hypothetical protein